MSKTESPRKGSVNGNGKSSISSPPASALGNAGVSGGRRLSDHGSGVFDDISNPHRSGNPDHGAPQPSYTSRLYEIAPCDEESQSPTCDSPVQMYASLSSSPVPRPLEKRDSDSDPDLKPKTIGFLPSLEQQEDPTMMSRRHSAGARRGETARRLPPPASPAEKKKPKRWMIFLQKAKKKCKHPPGSPKFIDACRMVLAVQQRFSRLWMHLEHSRTALSALLDERQRISELTACADDLQSSKEQPDEREEAAAGKRELFDHEAIPWDQQEELELVRFVQRFRRAADEIEALQSSETDCTDWTTLGLYVGYGHDAGLEPLDHENINLQDWIKLQEQLGEKERALEEADDPQQQAELALCRTVRQLLRDLMKRYRGSVQWRLLLEFLYRACSLQDFLERKTRDFEAQAHLAFENSFFGTYGPMGDLPLHLIFLMGMEPFCEECMLRVYGRDPKTGQNRLDLPYKSDLWMALDEESYGVQNARSRWMKEGWLRPNEQDVSSMGMFTGETVLHFAIAKRRIAGLKVLLRQGVDLQCRTTGQFFAPNRVMPFRRPRRKAASLLDPLFNRKSSSTPTHNRMMHTHAELEPAIAEERYTFTELLKVTTFAQIWHGGYPLLQNPLSGFYGGEFPLAFAASVGDASIMQMLLDSMKEAVWADHLQAARVATEHGVKTKKGRFLMTVNPAFSNVMAAGAMEQLRLREAVQESKGNFINAIDSFGNTALHLAVTHGRTEALDWLMENGAMPSLTTLNVYGYTPFTLTAALGMPDMFMHILTKHMRRMLWSYGPISSVHTNLAQVDSFRMCEHKVAPHQAAKRNATVKALSGSRFSFRRFWESVVDGVSSAYAEAKEISLTTLRPRANDESDDAYFEDWEADGDNESRSNPELETWADEEKSDAMTDKFNERTIVALHTDPNWRSALEIIIHQEITVFLEHEETSTLIKDLVREKWDRFGRRMHITKRVMPYLSFVLCWTTICVMRSAQVRIETLQSSQKEIDTLNEVQTVLMTTMEGVVVFLGVPTLARSAWSGMRTKISDLDTNLDGCIDASEKVLFLYKNMSSLLDFFSALCIVFCALLRAAGQQNTELDVLAIVSVVIWCNILTCFVPFRFFGTMVITIHKMLVGDVAIFLVVYILINVAFGLAIFICMQGGNFPQDETSQEELKCVGCDAYFGSMVLKLVWVSLGETEQTPLIGVTRNPGLAACLHIVFVVLSLILLLNLIIAMMGDTFQKQFEDVEKHWFFPYADLVLRYESKLSQRQKCKLRAGTPIAMNNKQRHLSPNMTFHWREELLAT